MRTNRKWKPVTTNKDLYESYLIDFFIAFLAGVLVLALDKISNT